MPPPFNVTGAEEIEEVRDFIQRVLAAQDPSDLNIPKKLSSEEGPVGHYVITISWKRLPGVRGVKTREVIRPALVVRRRYDDVWEIDFDEDA